MLTLLSDHKYSIVRVQTAHLWILYDLQRCQRCCFIISLIRRTILDVLKREGLDPVQSDFLNEGSIPHFLESNPGTWINIQTLDNKLFELITEVWPELVHP